MAVMDCIVERDNLVVCSILLTFEKSNHATRKFKPGHGRVRKRLTPRTYHEQISTPLQHERCPMAKNPAPLPQSDAEQLDAAADQAIAACGGDARAAVKALIVANEFLESEVSELMKAVSQAYARGRFQTYTG